METIEKYSRTEYERRWLVRPDSDWKALVEPYSRHLCDRYIDGSRLRLRHQLDVNTGRQMWKLTKKYVPVSWFQGLISSLVLDAAEAELMSSLPADEIAKTRFYHTRVNGVTAIDVFEGDLAALVMCEIESNDLASLMRISAPPYAAAEVTGEDFFTGGTLCRITATELKKKLDSIL
jgi:CYTH domain-containing protein